MMPRGVLVRFPGNPFSLDALLPDSRVAALAEWACGAGHVVEVADFGVVPMHGMLVPTIVRRAAEHWFDDGSYRIGMDGIRAAWQHASMSRALRRTRIESGLRAVEELTLPADYILFFADTHLDYEVIWTMGRHLRQNAPETTLAITGELPVRWRAFPGDLPRNVDLFDCVFEPTALQRIVEWPVWKHVKKPGSTDQGFPPWAPPFWMPEGHETADTPPRYAPEYYPAMGDATGKLKLFVIPPTPYRAVAGDMGTYSQSYPIDAIRNPLHQHGIRAFHLRESAIGAAALAARLLRSGTRIAYSCDMPLEPSDLHAHQLLRVSGCQAVRYHVHSGSQRLLEDFYGSRLGVTALEHLFRDSHEAGLIRIAQLTYPCRFDDEHTREETLRLLDRTQPESVVIGSMSNEDTYYPYEQSVGPDYEFGPMLQKKLERRVVRFRRELIERINRLRIPVGCSASMALLARVLGEDEDLPAFVHETARMLYTADSHALANLTSRFNHAALSIEATWDEELPGAPLRAAVGN